MVLPPMISGRMEVAAINVLAYLRRARSSSTVVTCHRFRKSRATPVTIAHRVTFVLPMPCSALPLTSLAMNAHLLSSHQAGRGICSGRLDKCKMITVVDCQKWTGGAYTSHFVVSRTSSGVNTKLVCSITCPAATSSSLKMLEVLS